jgi:hypothetical protein
VSAANRLLYLRVALMVFGLIFIFGVYPLAVVWSSGRTWGQARSYYLMEIVSIYATLGVFFLLASRNPNGYRSVIWFTICSSVVHGAIMAAQSLGAAAERGHLLGDVPALFIVAIVLGVLMTPAAQA